MSRAVFSELLAVELALELLDLQFEMTIIASLADTAVRALLAALFASAASFFASAASASARSGGLRLRARASRSASRAARSARNSAAIAGRIGRQHQRSEASKGALTPRWNHIPRIRQAKRR